MTDTLFGRTIYEKRWFMLGWSMVFAFMSTLVLMFYPSFSQGGGFDEVAKTLPTQLQGFIGDPSVFASLEGFIVSQVFDVRMSLLVIIMTLVLATSLSLKEEENGDMRTTLMTSLSRTRYVLEKLLAAIAIIFVICLATIAGIYIGITSLGEPIPHGLLWKLFVLTVFFAIVAFAIPYSISLATGKRSVTMFFGLTIALGSYLLSTFARAVDWLKDWEMLSLVHYYDTAGLRENSFELLNVVVLGIIGLVVIATALLMFSRRDIA